ncbi:MAG: Tad domain-containing protein [Coriobacteriia bacterium]|nr:Tad domain-containing protein [Coriobacteriia bacterium]
MMRLMKDDEGATAVTVALVMFVLVLFAALAVDVGYGYSVRRQLQTAADAAALAGCRVLADKGTNAEVLAVAEDYADRNAVAPGDGLSMLEDPPDTEVGADYVQVTVMKDAPLFFGRILGSESAYVQASARARIAYLTGLKGIVPWGVPIIRANKVSVRIGGGQEVWLTDQGSGLWRTTVAAPGATSTAGYPVDITVYNDQTSYPDGTVEYPNGVPEPMPGAAAVAVLPAGCPITDVSLSAYVVTARQDTSVELRVASPTEPEARFNGKKHKMTEIAGQPGMWRATLPVPDSDDLIATFPVNVSTSGCSLTSAAVLIVRRSTYPVADVSLTDYVVGPGGTLSVSVRLHDYAYGERYELRVAGGGGEVGNFCSIDLSTTRHTPNWRNPQHPAEYDVTSDPAYKLPTYYCYLEKPFPFVIHIGDTIWTEPGAMSGPQSSSALAVRFGGDDRTFAEWVASGDTGSARVVYVPVLEKMQYVTGTSPMRVVGLASFYVEPESNIKKNDIVGRFIEYVTPSDSISDTPPDGLYVETVRLVPPQ